MFILPHIGGGVGTFGAILSRYILVVADVSHDVREKERVAPVSVFAAKPRGRPDARNVNNLVDRMMHF